MNLFSTRAPEVLNISRQLNFQRFVQCSTCVERGRFKKGLGGNCEGDLLCNPFVNSLLLKRGLGVARKLQVLFAGQTVFVGSGFLLQDNRIGVF